MERGQGADGNAQRQRQQHGNRAKLQGHREALPDKLGHREVLVLERGSKIAVRQRAEVAAVLFPDGLIQSVGTLQIGHDLRRQRLLLIEGSAGSCADQEKSNGYNDEEGGNRACEAGQKVAQHRISLSVDRKVDKPSRGP